jgi:hypothetical protein
MGEAKPRSGRILSRLDQLPPSDHSARQDHQGEAYAIAASGSPYLIGYFDADGNLTRVVKMLRGAVFFDFVYVYYPNGKVKRVEATNTRGEVTVREYDGSRRPGFFW